MSSSDNSQDKQALSNVNNQQELAGPQDRQWAYDSGLRTESDGSQWREKGEAEFKKTESGSGNDYSRTETYPLLLLFNFPYFL